MKHSFIYKIIMAIVGRIHFYYKESYTRSIINRLFDGLGSIYFESTLYKILSIRNSNVDKYIETSIIGKLVKLFNWFIKSLRGLLEHGIEGSSFIKLDKALTSNFDSYHTKSFLTALSIGVLASYNVLKVLNKGFSTRTIIFDVIVLCAILSIRFIKISTTINNSFVFKLTKGFVVPRGEVDGE